MFLVSRYKIFKKCTMTETKILEKIVRKFENVK